MEVARELKTLAEYHAWLRAMDDRKWREIVFDEKGGEEFVTIPVALRSDPHFDDFQSGDRLGELDVATGAYECVRAIREGDVVVDAGAHVGHFTKAAAAKASRVYAIEPSPRNASKIRGLELANVSVLQAACWHTSLERLTFHVSPSSVQGSVVGAEGAIGTLTVTSVRLDDFKLQRLDFLKIDVEGAEPETLMGARETLKRCRPFVAIEVFGEIERKRVDELLAEAGYWLVGVQPMLTLPLGPPNLPSDGLWHCKPR